MTANPNAIPTVATALPPKFIRRIWEPILKRILASRFHGMMSKNLMLINVTGRKTGARYTLPVPYVQEGDSSLIIMAAGVWWKNLRGGAPVTIRLRGETYQAHAEVNEDPEVIKHEVAQFLKKRPEVAQFLRIKLDSQHEPDAEGLARAAQLRVVVRVQLSDANNGQKVRSTK